MWVIPVDWITISFNAEKKHDILSLLLESMEWSRREDGDTAVLWEDWWGDRTALIVVEWFSDHWEEEAFQVGPRRRKDAAR